jgi:HEAT repeat protein
MSAEPLPPTTEQEEQVLSLVRALADGSRSERRAAVRTVKNSAAPDERLIRGLIALLATSDLDLRQEVAVALAEIGPPALGPLLAALPEADADRRRAIVLVLGMMGPAARGAAGTLRSLLNDDVVGDWAARALEQIEPPQPWQPLVVLGAWRWWLAALAAVLIALAVGMISRAAAVAAEEQAALTAAAGLGGLGVFMGLIVGGHVGGRRRVWLFAGSCGVGGAAAGWLLTWILFSLIAPVVRVLGR